jgi:NDP-sugar pyrophosphorylase family protein
MTQILIIAGGLGTRIAAIAKKRPKCMLEVEGRPFCEYQLELFKKQGFNDIIFCLGHLADVVMDYFEDGRKFGLNIGYSIEKEPLGTAGAVKLAEKQIDGNFIVFYGDNFTDMKLRDFLEFHEQYKGMASINVRKKNDVSKSSSIIIINNHRITSFIEKPSGELLNRFENAEKYVNNGIYVCRREILDNIPKNKVYDFGFDLFPDMLLKGEKLYGYAAESYFREIGTPQKIDLFTKEFKSKKNDLGLA